MHSLNLKILLSILATVYVSSRVSSSESRGHVSCLFVHVCIRTFVYMYVCVCVWVCVCAHVYVYMCVMYVHVPWPKGYYNSL